MTKFTLVAILTIGVVKTLPLLLHEFRRRCLAISSAMQVLIFSMITTCVRIHELSSISRHALPFEVTFCCVEEEKVGFVLVPCTLTFVMRNIWL